MGIYTTPVLIVGAGPTGAVLALELARHGVASMVVERSVRPSVHPKMDYLNGRSMELLRRLGLADLVRQRGVDPDSPTDFMWTRGLAESPVLVWHHPSVNDLRTRYGQVNDGTAPAEPYQRLTGSLLERLLREIVRGNELIDLREGWTLSDLRQEPSGVTATVLDRSTNVRHAVEARYVAACDGASSTVRTCLEIPLETLGEPTQHCSVYFTSGDPALRRHGPAFVTIGAAGLNLVSRDEQKAWTASVSVSPDEPLTANPLTLVRERLGVDFMVENVISVAQWEGSLSVAAAYRAGAAYLVGDAAHQFYPTGGYGANTGIGDAVDLGWKLAATVNGWGGPRLLASYQAERRPVALFHRELSCALLEVWRRFGRLATAGAAPEQLAGVLAQESFHIDNLGVHFGTRYARSPIIWPEPGNPPPWHWDRITPTTWPGCRAPAIRLADGEQLFDRLGAGFTLVDLSDHGLGEPLVKEAIKRGVPMTHLALDDVPVRDCWQRNLVLVRPDQHVAWRGDEPPDNWDAVLDLVTGKRAT